MKYNIVFGELANITLEYNLAFLLAFNPSYSLKMRKCITNAINNLSSFPHSHPIYKEIENCIYRKLIVNSLYHIIYTVKKDYVFVFYVTDARKGTDEYISYLK